MRRKTVRKAAQPDIATHEAPPTDGSRTAPWHLRFDWRRDLVLFIAAALGGSIIIVFGLMAHANRKPIVQYESQTSIVRLRIVDQDLVWNLPQKKVQVVDYTDDGPVTRKLSLGIGPLIMPPGTVVQVTRIPGQSLHIRIVDTRGASPSLVDASQPQDIRPGKGAVITIDGINHATGSNRSDCDFDLPPMAVRGTGLVKIGATMQVDSADTSTELAKLTPDDYVDRMIQPTLISGKVLIQARTPSGDDYMADEISLQTGDMIDMTDDKPAHDRKEPGSDVGTFILTAVGCSALSVRGRMQFDDLKIMRLGSDPAKIRISIWQIMLHDSLISIFSAIAAFLFAGLAAYETLQKLWARSGRAGRGRSSTTHTIFPGDQDR